MANVCQKCGVSGFVEALVFCSVCKTSAEHRYCMFVLPKYIDELLSWTCEECSPTFPTVNLCYKNILNRSWEESVVNTPSQNNCDEDYEHTPYATVKSENLSEPHEISLGVQSYDGQCSAIFESHSDVKLEAACRSMPSPGHPMSANSNCIKDIRKKMILDDEEQYDEEQISQSSIAVHLRKTSKSKGRLLTVDDCFSNEENLSTSSFVKGSTNCDLRSLKSNVNEEKQINCSISIKNEETLKRKRRRLLLDKKLLDQEVFNKTIVGKGSSKAVSFQDFDMGNPNVKNNCSIAIGSKHQLKTKRQKSDKEHVLVKNKSLQIVSFQTSESNNANSQSDCSMTMENKELVISNTQKLILDKARPNGEDLDMTDVGEDYAPNLKSSMDSKEEKFMPCEAIIGDDDAPSHQLMQGTFDIDNVEKISSGLVSSDCPSNIDVLPIIVPIWSGYFGIHNEVDIPIVAHLSNRACEKVYSKAKTLPLKIFLERKTKMECWPETFRRSVPTSDNIALYFFPSNTSDTSTYEQLLEDVIVGDFMLKVILDEAELIILPSVVLPLCSKFFDGKLYFWGAFMRKKIPVSVPPINSDAMSHRCIMPCLDLTAKVCAFCRGMDSDGFWRLVVKSPRSKVEELHSELPSLLEQCVDPFRFVVDAMSTVFPLNLLKGEKHEWICLLLLKSLASSMRISGSRSASLLSSVSTRKEARKIADLWKAANILKVRSQLPYARTFLFHVVTFNIVIDEEKGLYRNLLMYLFWDEKISELVIPLRLNHKTVIGMVRTLIGKGREIHALPFIYHAKLVDEFHPLSLLKSCLKAFLQEISFQYRNTKIHNLNTIMDYICRFKLENEFPVEPLKMLINILTNKKDLLGMSGTTLNRKIGKLRDELLSYCSTKRSRPFKPVKTKFRGVFKRSKCLPPCHRGYKTSYFLKGEWSTSSVFHREMPDVLATERLPARELSKDPFLACGKDLTSSKPSKARCYGQSPGKHQLYFTTKRMISNVAILHSYTRSLK